MSNPLSSLVGGIADEIPGVSVIESVISQLDTLAKEINHITDAVSHFDVVAMVQAVTKEAHRGIGVLGGMSKPDWSWVTSHIESTIFSTMLKAAFGLDPEQIEDDAPGSVKTLDQLLGFSIGLPLIFAGLHLVLKLFGAQRMSEAVGELFGRIPEEMGVNWAIGMFMNTAMEAAIGNKFEEAISKQKMPNAPDWRIVRLMVTKHLIGEKALDERLQAMGYDATWRANLKALGDTFIPVGDLQQLYLYDKLNRDDVKQGVELLGFHADDAELLTQLYVDKAQTSSGVMLRSIARQLAVNQLITLGDYEGYLKRTNLPDAEVTDDLNAVGMEIYHGRLRTPLSAIKTQFEHGVLTADEVRNALQHLGYTLDATKDLLTSWSEGKLPHPMSASKVLTYWYSHVITDRTDALNRLIATGLRPQDATFLLDHPTAGGAKLHQLTPSLLVAGFLDGAVDQGELEQKLIDAGATPEAAKVLYSNAIFRHSRLKRPAGAPVPLTATQWLDAMNYGIVDPVSTQGELIKLGYTADDALILMEIKSKGGNPLAKVSTGAVLTLSDALQYMVDHGYEVVPPPDPQLTAAESVLSAAGYSWEPLPPFPTSGAGGIKRPIPPNPTTG